MIQFAVRRLTSVVGLGNIRQRTALEDGVAVNRMTSQLGIDIGATFTDLLLIDETGAPHPLKSPNRDGDPVAGIADGIRQISSDAGIAPGDIDAVVHAAPAPITGSAPLVGLLVTAGFEHVLHLARGQRGAAADGWVVATLGVPERVGADGQIRQPVDENLASMAIRSLLDSGATAIAVSLLNATANPEHERNLRRLVKDIADTLPVTLSSDVVSEAAEYERTVAAVLDAAHRPVLVAHFDALAKAFHRMDLSTGIRVARSDGGSMTVAHAAERPVEALNAGFAAGVTAAAAVAARTGRRDALALDMGSAEAAIGAIVDGAAAIARKTAVGGVNLMLPSVDMMVTAIGGSALVRVTDHGAIRIGPERAASGPASFGGGSPTLTDANVVLGLIPASSDGNSPNLAAAEDSIGQIAGDLGVTLHRAAQGIRDVANEKLYGALRQTAVVHGLNVAGLPIIAYGGAGPLHGNALGALCASASVIIPAMPAMMTVRGFLESRARREFGRSCRALVDDMKAVSMVDLVDTLATEATQWLEEEDVGETDRHVAFQADLRYRGRGKDITLDFRPDDLPNWGLKELSNRFEIAFESAHGVRLNRPVEMARVRAVATDRNRLTRNGAGAPQRSGGGDPSAARVGEQRVFLDNGFRNFMVYRAALLKAGDVVPGPALVTSEGSTAVVQGDYDATVDAAGSLILTPDEARRRP